MTDTPKVVIAAKSTKLDIQFDGVDDGPRRSLQLSLSNENLHSVARLLFMHQLGFNDIPETKAVIPFKHTCNGTVVESKSPFTWSLNDGVINFNLDKNVFVHHHWACHADLVVPVLVHELNIGIDYAFAGRLKDHPSVFAYKYTHVNRDTEMVLLTDRKSFYVILANSNLVGRGWYSMFGYNKEMVHPDWNAMRSKEFRGEQAKLCDKYGFMVRQYISVDNLITDGVIADSIDNQ